MEQIRYSPDILTLPGVPVVVRPSTVVMTIPVSVYVASEIAHSQWCEEILKGHQIHWLLKTGKEKQI